MGEIDAATLEAGTELTCDICIVGSGAAGITLAHRLSELTRGSSTRIIVLESSLHNVRDPFAPEQLLAVQRFQTTSAAPARAMLSEAVAARADLLAFTARNEDGHRFEDPDTQPLYRAEISEEMKAIDPRFPLRSRIRCYGGTTNCWGGWTRTLSPIDFDRSDLDPTFAWPITFDDLREPYKAALRYCSLGAFDPSDYDDAKAWVGRTTTPIDVIPDSQELRTGVFSIMNGDSRPDHLDGRLDFQLVWGPEVERAPNVTLVKNANVRRLEARGSSLERVHAQALVQGPDPKPGIPFTVRAGTFVLAAGGIETVRLLLLSEATGIPNAHGQLGRNFMVHPLNTDAGTVQLTGRVPGKFLSLYDNSAWPPPQLRAPAEFPPRIFGTFVPTDATLKAEGIGNFRAWVGFNGGRSGSGSINLNWEQLPNPNSRITLSTTKRDLFGDAEAFVDWQTTPHETKTAQKAIDLVISQLVALGYASGGTGTPRITAPGDHHMGATRMSARPADGYVDANCRTHEVDNLYIASSSVFSTGGVSNPTLTIVALAVRLAEHLAAR